MRSSNPSSVPARRAPTKSRPTRIGQEELPAYILVEEVVSIPAGGGVGSEEANCPADTQIVTGGAFFGFPSGDISASTVDAETAGWFGEGQNNGGAPQNLTVRAYCLPNGTPSERRAGTATGLFMRQRRCCYQPYYRGSAASPASRTGSERPRRHAALLRYEREVTATRTLEPHEPAESEASGRIGSNSSIGLPDGSSIRTCLAPDSIDDLIAKVASRLAQLVAQAVEIGDFGRARYQPPRLGL